MKIKEIHPRNLKNNISLSVTKNYVKESLLVVVPRGFFITEVPRNLSRCYNIVSPRLELPCSHKKMVKVFLTKAYSAIILSL